LLLAWSVSALAACGGLDGSGLLTSSESALCRGDDACSGDDSRDDSADASGGATTTASACQTDADCAAGLECEVEHGSGYCKAHGGGDEVDRSDDDHAGADDADAGSAAGGHDTDCATSADCAAGLECEIEHGQGYCKAHGGNTEAATGCKDDADCASGERCESIGQSQRACFAAGDGSSSDGAS
jgi:hypothetical protein